MKTTNRPRGAARTRGRAATGRRAAMVAGVMLIVLAVPAGAFAASSPPQIASSFTPALIAAGGTSALGFTITNPNATGSLTNVSLTDTLPAGLVVDTQPGTTTSSTCGTKSTPATVTATPGAATITVSGATVAAGAANACTISVSVTAAASGVLQNSTGAVTATGTAPGNSDTQSLTVAGLPTLSIGSPHDGATFIFKQKVRARFACQDGPLGPGLSDCSGTDDQGNSVLSGDRLDTSVLGTHTLTVDATSLDGAVTEQAITYTVLPTNHLPLTRVTPATSGAVTVGLRLPGAGKVQILESTPTAGAAAVHLVPGPGRFAFGKLTKTVRRGGTFTLTIKPASRGASLVANASSPVVIRITVAYTPAHGRARVVSVPGIVIPQ